LDYLTTRTSLSPIQRGFVPGFVFVLFIDVASDGAYDHMKLNNGIKYSYTYELRPSSGSSQCFVLPESQIEPTIEETFASLWKFAEEIYADNNGGGRK